MVRKRFRIMPALMALLMALSVVAPAFAAESTVTYTGPSTLFEFEPGSYWTDTDLFENFKGVMPGDVLYEEVKVKNATTRPVQIWMGGLLHDEEENPISPRVLEELIADGRKGELSELEYMHDFLSQMTLTVWKGEMIDRNIIYQGTPNTLEEGFEDGFVSLGVFPMGSSVKLNVRLEVPITMGNEYSYRIGEVDWIFVVQDDGPGGGPGFEPDPTPPPTPGTDPTYPPGVTPTPEITPTPEVTPTPEPTPGMSDVPQTGDTTVFWPFVILFAVGFVGMFLTLFLKRKKEEEDE